MTFKPFTKAMQALKSVVILDKQSALDAAFEGMFHDVFEYPRAYSVQTPSVMHFQPGFFSLSDAGQLIDELRDQYRLNFKAVGVVVDEQTYRHSPLETTNPLKLAHMDPMMVHLNSPYFDIHVADEKTTFIIRKDSPQSEIRRLDFIFEDIILPRKFNKIVSLEDFFKNP